MPAVRIRFPLTLLGCGLAWPHAALAHHLPGHEEELWQPEWPVIIALALALILYLKGLRTLWRTASPGRGIGRGEAASFIAGWLVLATALLPPVHTLGEALFSVHMIEHELLMAVAAPLLVLGRPLVVFLWALPRPTRRVVGAWSAVRPMRLVWGFFMSALAAWTLHAIALWIWHLPALFEAALASELVHTVQHVCFLGAALLYWTSLLRSRRDAEGRGAAVISLFATALHSSILGALLTLSTVSWYPAYGARSAAWGLSAIEDQQLAGLVMWVPGGLIYLGIALALVAAWLRQAETQVRRWQTALAREGPS
jgi:cytochrome c oxidase assembly factor CtaG